MPMPNATVATTICTRFADEGVLVVHPLPVGKAGVVGQGGRALV